MVGSFLSFLFIVNLGVHGHAYAIEEPDLLTEIEQKAQSPQVKKELSEKVRKSYLVDIYLPDAKVASKHTLEMKYEVPEDLIINGDIVARRGQVINVLERVKLTTKYLFIKEHQVPLFLKLFGKDKSIAAVIIQGDLLTLNEKYPDHRIYIGSRQLIDKFQVTRVPALVYQDGLKIVVEEIPYITRH